MTINKLQGQSLKIVGVDLQISAFRYGQLYIALSWVKSTQEVTVSQSENSDRKKNNIVYSKVLLQPPQT